MQRIGYAWRVLIFTTISFCTMGYGAMVDPASRNIQFILRAQSAVLTADAAQFGTYHLTVIKPQPEVDYLTANQQHELNLEEFIGLWGSGNTRLSMLSRDARITYQMFTPDLNIGKHQDLMRLSSPSVNTAKNTITFDAKSLDVQDPVMQTGTYRSVSLLFLAPITAPSSTSTEAGRRLTPRKICRSGEGFIVRCGGYGNDFPEIF